jgi:hypothetical protein
MNELVHLSQPGTFKSGPNLLTIGVVDVDVFLKNLIEGGEISNRTFEQCFYIETISLRLQHIEIYLRMFYVFKDKEGKLIDGNADKRTFGSLISDCERLKNHFTTLFWLHILNFRHSYSLQDQSGSSLRY